MEFITVVALVEISANSGASRVGPTPAKAANLFICPPRRRKSTANIVLMDIRFESIDFATGWSAAPL